jgi:predicted metalloprotease with PDZ domain
MRSSGARLRLALALAVLALPLALRGQKPSPIALSVDASEAPRRIFHVTESIPVSSGALTLVYPKWIPGEHGPTGPMADLAGLKISAGGRPIPWKREASDMWAFTLDVPAGVSTVEAAFDYLSPAAADGFSSGATATAQLAVVSWNTVLLYPKRPNSNDLILAPRLKLPAGWKYGTSLTASGEAGGWVEFAPVTLVTLIDSPVLSGAYWKTVELTPGAKPVHLLHIAGDSAAAIEMDPEDLAHYKRLVAETGALFGARHYNEYHFLLTLSDHVPSFGLEHHQSSDNRVAERSLLEDSAKKVMGTLLSHEFTHSWNGKYRRPAGLVTGVSADYQAPIQSELLWVYEGLTEYYGDVLGARSGLRTPELYRENIALFAAAMDHQAGRGWRPLVDTATAAQLLYGARPDWAAWRRGVDFYPESELIWLEADVLIRKKTGGRRSLDDFCKAFHGPPGGPPAVKTYTFDDVVAALNAVATHDWAGFFKTRIFDVAPRAPLGGVEESGWKLVYTDVKPQLTRAAEEQSKLYDFWYSLGITVEGSGGSGSADEGVVRDVVPGMPAATAGVGPGMRLVAVNGRRYSEKVLRDALRAAKGGKDPIELLVENVETFKTCKVDYHGGEKYPHLERDASKPDLLSAIGKSLTSATGRQ